MGGPGDPQTHHGRLRAGAALVGRDVVGPGRHAMGLETPTGMAGDQRRRHDHAAQGRTNDHALFKTEGAALPGQVVFVGAHDLHLDHGVGQHHQAQHHRHRRGIAHLVEGKCVSHELDVIVQKDMHLAMIECKFHGSQETKTDVKVPMYILSRFNDLKDRDFQLFKSNYSIQNCWITTNNRFTDEAVKFASCSKLSLLSWDYPKGNSLKNKIDLNQIYPVTCLTTLTTAEKDKLLVQDIITALDLIQHADWLSKIELSPNRIKNVLLEANQLCNLIK